MVNQGCMSLSTYYLEYGRHVAQLHHHHRHCRRPCAPTSNTANHDNHEKINSWVSLSFLYEYGAPAWLPFGPLERRYYNIARTLVLPTCNSYQTIMAKISIYTLLNINNKTCAVSF